MRLLLLCRPLFLGENSRWSGGQDCEEGRRGAARGRLPLPYLTRHVARGVAAAGCDAEDEHDEPPPSKTILREGVGDSEGKTHTHCVLPRREKPPSRETLHSSQHPPRLRQLAPGSGSGPHAPAHLCTGAGRLGEGRGARGAGRGWVAGRRRSARPARGAPRPRPRGAAHAQWPLPQAGGGNMAE